MVNLEKKLTTNTSRHILLIGGTEVHVVDEICGNGKFFIHVHQNEDTALNVAKNLIQEVGGRIITLQHPGQRNIVFCLKQSSYEFDPNRIFTDCGIKKTLQAHGAYDQEAHLQVKKLANLILSLLPKGKVIAVHNNAEYSMHDYLPQHPHENEALAMHLSESQFYRNFYLVTQKKTYHRLKAGHFNCILQAKSVEDDGSLSVVLADRDYINIEAGYDQADAQKIMLQEA